MYKVRHVILLYFYKLVAESYHGIEYAMQISSVNMMLMAPIKH